MDQWIRRIVGVLQIGGGFFGFAVTAMQFDGQSVLGSLLVLAFCTLFAFSTVAGVALVEGSRWGRRASVVCWWLQLPIVSSPLIVFSFWTGAYVSIHARFTGFLLGFNLEWATAGFKFAFFRDRPYLIGINLFAALVLYLLDKFVDDPVVAPCNLPPAIEPRASLAERIEAGRIEVSQQFSSEHP